MIKDLKDTGTKSALNQVAEWEKILKGITDREKKIKQMKKNHKLKENELAEKIEQKRTKFTEEEAKPAQVVAVSRDCLLYTSRCV